MGFDRPSTATPAVVQLEAGETTVEFTWHRDRWRHKVRTVRARDWLSIEGVDDGADPRWPQSPVLTEVSLAEVAGKPVLLGVGLAGRSHFSLCVTIHQGLQDTLLFEAACRIHTVAEWLGSSYRGTDGRAFRIEPQAPFPAPPATICWTYTAGPNGILAVTRAAEA